MHVEGQGRSYFEGLVYKNINCNLFSIARFYLSFFCQHYVELDMTKYQPSLYSNVEELASTNQAVSLEAENTHL